MLSCLQLLVVINSKIFNCFIFKIIEINKDSLFLLLALHYLF